MNKAYDITRRGKMYVLDTRITGERKRVSLRTTDYSEALRRAPEALAELVREAEQESVEKAGSGITLAEGFRRAFIEEWNALKDKKHREGHVAEIMDFLGADTLLVDIDRAALLDLQGHFQSQPAKNGEGTAAPATVNRKMAVIRRMLNMAHKLWDEIPSVPYAKQLKEPECRYRYLSVDEQHELLQTTGPEFRMTWEFLMSTGLRVGEYLQLEWRHFDLAGGSVRLDPRIMQIKAFAARELPLDDVLLRQLKERKGEGKATPFPARATSYSALRDEWARVTKAMDLEDDSDFVIHTLRHTCATQLVNNNVSVATVKKWMGHKCISTTMRYVNQSTKDLEGLRNIHRESRGVPKAQLRAVN